MTSRVDMAGRRLSESTVESSSHSRTQNRSIRKQNSSERSMHSNMLTLTNSISLGSIDVDNTSIASSLDDESLLDPMCEFHTVKPLKTNKKSVRFCSVYLREHSICLGDNPSVSRGAPIALDWNVLRELKFSLDAFENSEHFAGTNEDSNQSFKYSSLERMHVLKKIGYSRNEIQDASDAAQKIKQERIRTRRKLERSDRINRYLRSISRLFLFRSPCDVCDPNKALDVSMNTVSTRSSTDWSTVSIEMRKEFPNTPNNRSSRSSMKRQSSGRSIEPFGNMGSQDWKDDFFRQLQLQKKDSGSNFLDQARHPKNFSSLDLVALCAEMENQ